MQVRILSASDVRSALPMRVAIDTMRRAFSHLSAGTADVPLRGRVATDKGVSLVMPAIAMGNRVVVTPSPAHPLAAADFYQVLDTSDVPGGVGNIVTGDRDTLADTMAKHDDIAALWYFGSADGTAMVERESAGNLKALWANNGTVRDWFDPEQGQGEEFLFRAVRIKTIWTPFGV